MKFNRLQRIFSLCFVLGLLVVSCKKEEDKTSVIPEEKAFIPVPIDSLAINDFLKAKPVFAPFEKDFKAFYASNDYKYAWYDQNGMIEFAHLLVGYLSHEDKDGIYAKIPYREEFLERVHYKDSDTIPQKQLTKPDITTELLLTGAYFYYAQHSWGGNTSAKVTDWHLPKKTLNYSELLSKNLKNQSLKELESESVIPQYLGLKEKLNQYRHQLRKGAETVVPNLDKAVLKEKDTSNLIGPIKRRLVELGYEVGGDTLVFDSALKNTINQFKENHGYLPNGIINQAIISELNTSIQQRIEQIQVNMERFRWIQKGENPKQFILVNIPDYRLHFYEKDAETWSCNVVVGKSMHQTVIFSGMMSYLVFSPYWNIPNSIVENEVKPGIARDKNYLAKHNMEKYKGMYRQKPGPRNSLGLVKFMFPNSNNIYLHDSPAKSLFNLEERSFSHGCIRVAEPKKLAEKILKNYPGWTSEKIDAAMNSGKEKYVTLKEKIPVYIGYFTAFVDKDGQLNFRKDIYNLDPGMLQLLKGDH